MMGLRSQLLAIRSSVTSRKPHACGCEHEGRFGVQLLQIGINFHEAIERSFCSNLQRRNPMCAHTSLKGVLADPYRTEITALFRLGILDETWVMHSREIALQISVIDGDAAIQRRAGRLDSDRIRNRQLPILQSLITLRQDLLQLLEQHLQ